MHRHRHARPRSIAARRRDDVALVRMHPARRGEPGDMRRAAARLHRRDEAARAPRSRRSSRRRWRCRCAAGPSRPPAPRRCWCARPRSCPSAPRAARPPARARPASRAGRSPRCGRSSACRPAPRRSPRATGSGPSRRGCTGPPARVADHVSCSACALAGSIIPARPPLANLALEGNAVRQLECAIQSSVASRLAAKLDLPLSCFPTGFRRILADIRERGISVTVSNGGVLIAAEFLMSHRRRRPGDARP